LELRARGTDQSALTFIFKKTKTCHIGKKKKKTKKTSAFPLTQYGLGSGLTRRPCQVF